MITDHDAPHVPQLCLGHNTHVVQFSAFKTAIEHEFILQHSSAYTIYNQQALVLLFSRL